MQGLRAYMIRVYNYMAMGVALTGVVSWLTFNAAASPSRRASSSADAVRPDDLQRTGDDRAVPRARSGWCF